MHIIFHGLFKYVVMITDKLSVIATCTGLKIFLANMQSPVLLTGKNAIPGDLLVLTKPLGTGLARKIKQWWDNDPEKRERLKLVIKEDELMECFNFADRIIKTSNNPALQLISKYQVHAVTLLSSGGIIEAGKNLAEFQNSLVDFLIHNLPVIKRMDDLCSPFSYEPDLELRLTQGLSPEVAGGLLIAMPRQDAVEFCQEIFSITKFPAWIVGTVNYGVRTAKLVQEALVLNVYQEFV